MPAFFLPHLALLSAMLVWGSSFIAIKIALTAFTPVELMACRMLVALTIFAPALPRLWRHLRAQGQWGLVLLMISGEPCLYFLCETYGLQYTSAAQAGMITSLLPLCVTAAAFFLLGERTGMRTWAGLGLAITGVTWLSLGGVSTESAPAPLLGNLLEMLAMLCATLYTICARRLSLHYSAMEITGMQVTGGALFFCPLALAPIATPLVVLPMTLPSWFPAAMVVYLGTVVTFVGYGFYNYGIRRLSASQAAAYCNLMPVVALGLGVTVLNEVITLAQYAASGLVILGVLLSQGNQQKDSLQNGDSH